MFVDLLSLLIHGWMLSMTAALLLGDTEELEMASGVSFTRDIKQIPGAFDMQLDGNHCQSKDDYGDNNCLFKWGENITGNYTLTTSKTIDEGHKMEGHFKVSNVQRMK